MRRIYHLLLLALIVNISAFGADFKIGDIKYEVLKDGTVKIKDAKKATGDFVIEPTVTDPKSGKSYTVSSIGKNAFKKSTITSVIIPESVKEIGNEAFRQCPDLTSVTLSKNIRIIPSLCFDECTSLSSINLDGITTIGEFAFFGTGFSDIRIPASVNGIERRAFVNCKNLKDVRIAESNRPLGIGTGIFLGSPLETIAIERNIVDINDHDLVDKPEYKNSNAKKTILIIGEETNGILSEKFLRNIPNVSSILFSDQDATEQALNVFSSLMGEEIPISMATNYFIYKASDYVRNILGNNRSFENCVNGKFNTLYHKPMPKCDYFVYYGTFIDDNNKLRLLQKQPLDIWEGIEKVYKNKRRQNFINKWAEFVNVAENKPSALEDEYRKLSPEEVVEFKDIFKSGITVLLDSVYLVKPTLSAAEIDNIEGFINNELHFIGNDYGLANLQLEGWAEADILNRDLTSGNHKEDYERILKSIDRYFSFKNSKENPYHQAMQLAALCGLERWKEAAAYFPKVHRAVTDNGQYLNVPYEITYMQNAINEHGYKAVAPTYKKATSKKSSAKSSSDNGSLIQFFMEAAVDAGIDHYKKKKREKDARELFYESMGLDKKGHPKKKK